MFSRRHIKLENSIFTVNLLKSFILQIELMDITNLKSIFFVDVKIGDINCGVFRLFLSHRHHRCSEHVYNYDIYRLLTQSFEWIRTLSSIDIR